MKGLVLFLIAYILVLPLTIINFFYVWNKMYFYDTALSIDIFANREYRKVWNIWFRTKDGYEFGNVGETISSALGKNERDNTLSRNGKVMVKILNFIDKNHCQKSIK